MTEESRFQFTLRCRHHRRRAGGAHRGDVRRPGEPPGARNRRRIDGEPGHRHRSHRELSGDPGGDQRLRSCRAPQDAGCPVRPADRLRRRDGGDEKTVGRPGRLGDHRRRDALRGACRDHRHGGKLAASRCAGRGAVHREGGLLLRHLRRPFLPEPGGRGRRRRRHGHPGGHLPHPLCEEGDGHPSAGSPPGHGDPPEAGLGQRKDRLCLELRRRVDRGSRSRPVGPPEGSEDREPYGSLPQTGSLSSSALPPIPTPSGS